MAQFHGELGTDSLFVDVDEAVVSLDEEEVQPVFVAAATTEGIAFERLFGAASFDEGVPFKVRAGGSSESFDGCAGLASRAVEGGAGSFEEGGATFSHGASTAAGGGAVGGAYGDGGGAEVGGFGGRIFLGLGLRGGGCCWVCCGGFTHG